MRPNPFRWPLGLLLSLMPAFAHAQFAGGSGTVADPWLIATAEQLDAIRNFPTNSYKLIADIDLGVAPWNEGDGWLPIPGFIGSIDGSSHSISNLRIRRENELWVGLFATAGGALIRNLNLVNVDVAGGSFTGALMGRGSTYLQIENVSVSGVVAGGSSVGGVVGISSFGRMDQVRSSAHVIGWVRVGGIVGIYSGHLIASRAEGSVTGQGIIGGLVGSLSGVIIDCSNHATVHAEVATVGGLVGLVDFGTLFRSYSAGPVSGNNAHGLASGSAQAFSSYWDREASGQNHSDLGQSRSTAEMMQKASYPWFNFDLIWELVEGVDYPTLRSVGITAGQQPVALADLAGSGTVLDPYIITTPDELHAMRQGMTNHYRLGNDIDLAVAIGWDGGAGWMPIGRYLNFNVNDAFQGSLDGAGHAISNLVTRRPGSEHQGLFAYTERATLKNLRLEGFDLLAGSFSGALAGRCEAYPAPDVHNDNIRLEGQILSTSNNVGGAIGVCSVDVLNHRMMADVRVRGTDNVGGLIGNITDTMMGFPSALRRSKVRGSVEGRNFVGGLIGREGPRPLGGGFRVDESASRAAVTGEDFVGGLVGGASLLGLSRCYSAGPVQGNGPNVGGLGGGGDTTNFWALLGWKSYWDIDASGQPMSPIGFGLSTEEMKRQRNYEHWNFGSLWTIEEDVDYPVFRDLDSYEQPIDIELADLQGEGTEEDPYIVTTIHELNAMRKGLDNHYRLGNDIDMADTLIWNRGWGWTLIGPSQGTAFTGSLDGDGFAIRHLTATLFSHTRGAVLENLRFLGINIPFGGGIVDVLASDTNGVPGRAANLYAEGFGALYRNEFPGLFEYGGLIGRVSGGSVVRNVGAHMDVLGQRNAGIIVGLLENGHVEGCFSTGTIDGSERVGGLVGHTRHTGTISNSYSRTSVVGSNKVGGLVGEFEAAAIHHAYAAGSVSGLGPEVGGLVGALGTNPVMVTEACWDVDRSEQPTSAAGLGRTTAEMTFPYDPETFENWDFADVWVADEDGRNNGYPYLAGSQIPTVTLSYDAGLGGSLIGPTTQTILVGADGAPVTTDPEAGAQFGRWSDGQGGAVRQDLGVSQNLSVTAFFKSEGGVDIDWYAGKGFFPGAGQTWANLDGLDPLSKGMTLSQDFVADTDPHDAASLFEIHDLDWTVGPRFHFRSSAARRYRLESREDLTDGEWLPVPGAGPRRGVGGEDAITDMNAPGGAVNYRLSVEVP